MKSATFGYGSGDGGRYIVTYVQGNKLPSVVSSTLGYQLCYLKVSRQPTGALVPHGHDSGVS